MPGPSPPVEVEDPEASSGGAAASPEVAKGYVRFDNGQPPQAKVTTLRGNLLNPQPGDRFSAYFIGSVEWNYRLSGYPMKLQADLLVVYADLEEVLPDEEGETDAKSEAADRSESAEDAGVAGEADAESRAAGSEGSEDAGAAKAGADGDEMTIGPYRFRKYTLYAEGRVRIEFVNSPTHLEADDFFYEHPSGLAVARNVRLMTTAAHAQTVGTAVSKKNLTRTASPLIDPSEPLVTSPVVIRADSLRMYAFRFFTGEGVVVSNSSFAVPPLALEAKSVDIYPVEMTPQEVERLKTMSPSELEVEGARELARRRATSGNRTGTEAGPGVRPGGAAREPGRRKGLIEGDHFVIDPESTRLSVLGLPIAPLPVPRWDTRWSYFLPFHSLQYGSSSEFGLFVDANWNVNYLLNLFPFRDTTFMRELDKNARMGFETAYFERRGFGFGPNVVYGTSPRPWQNWHPESGVWTYHGEARYFRIRDEGDEDRTTGLPIPQRDRHWGSVLHRQTIPYVGVLDVEYSDLSDDAFLGEFFEEIEKEEKEQESLFYLRREFRDNLAVTGLYKYRTDNFQPTIERIPEGKGFVLQEPVFGSGFYTDAVVSASNIRLRPGEPSIEASRRYDRYDLFNQWSYPVRALDPYVVFRPFSYTRYTYYGEVEDPDEGAEDRLTLAAGVSASQQWSRVFEFDSDSFASRILQISQLKHLIVPQATYLNAYSNDLDSEDVILTDRIDTVDLEESITLSLRNDFLTRRRIPGPPAMHPALLSNRNVQLESVQYATRRLFESNIAFVLYPQPHRDNGGDRSSLLRLDNTAYLNRLWLRGWFELDPNNDFHLERMDASARVTVIPDRLVFTIGDRFNRNRTSTFYADLRLWATPKWSFDGYWSHDLDDGRDVEWRVGVTRIFDRFAVSLEFIEDVGEDRNRTFLFTVSPVELFRYDKFRS